MPREEVPGIVNLRGKIVTIVDLGLRLGFPKAVARSDSRIFIIEDGNEFIGLLVDRVDEVVEVERGHWQAPPANVNWGQARFFQGVCRARGRVITLLDAGQILKLRNEITMNKLANIKIGKKLALLLASGIGAVVCIGSLSLWAFSAIRSAVGQEQIEGDQMMSAQRVGSDLGTVNAVVGHITLSQHCETCHGNRRGRGQKRADPPG